MVITALIDTSPLARAIPPILAFGCRTMQEQCVTSAVYVCRRAQELTPAADIGRIDAQMSATSGPAILKSGKLSRDKKRQRENIQVASQSLATRIVLQRLNPNSKYNARTGSRWALDRASFSPGAGSVGFWEKVNTKAIRMIKAMHSSTHFLQSGWGDAIRKGVTSPFYKHSAALGSRRQIAANPNPLAKSRGDNLGDLTIDLAGDAVTVTASNDVGESVGRSNPTLAALHRSYLIRFGVPAANQAIAEEAAGIDALVEKRLLEGMKVKFPELLS